MKRSAKFAVYSAAAAATLLLAGFIAFAASVAHPAMPIALAADGIVVLTGADRRIEAGLRLLHEGAGNRLLISGINRRTSPGDILRHVQADPNAEPCCIDFGYAARDTIGNASETRLWADHHGYKRLIVVTSSYHMPRSLNELALALPNAQLVAYPVIPSGLLQDGWWRRASATRMLVAEYLKLLPSYVRYAAIQILWPADTIAIPAPGTSRPRSAAL